MLPILMGILLCAQVSPEALDLRTAITTAINNHPLVSSGESRVLAAQGLRLQAGLRPNPRAIFQTENLRGWGDPPLQAGRDLDIYAYGAHLVETGGKRTRRTEFAQANLRRAELDRELIQKQIAGRVRFAYWNAAGAQRVQELLIQNTATLDQIVRYHEIRVREGAMAEADLLRVQLERERVAVAANSAALDTERARIQLIREMGQTDFRPVTLTDPLEPVPSVPVAELTAAFENRTEVKLAIQVGEQARANVRLQQSLATPDLELVAGYKRTNGFDTVIAGAQVAVPFLNRNQGAIAAAEAEIRAAESDLAAIRAIVAAEVRTALAEVRIREQQITKVFPGILQQARESARIAEAAYREGGSDLLRLLDSQRVRIETEVLYYRTLTEYRQSLAALETAMGVLQ